MTIRLIPPVDQLSRDDGALLLYEGNLLRLSPIAAAVADLARDGIDFEDLVTSLEARFGVPDTGSTTQATRAIVTELIDRGVIHAIELPASAPSEKQSEPTPAEDPPS